MITTGIDRCQLPSRSFGVVAAIELGGGHCLHGVGIEVLLRGPDPTAQRCGDVVVAVRRLRRPGPREPGCRGTDPRIARAAHDRHHAGDAVGVLDGHGLHDHAAHRVPHDVRPFDAQVIEQADPVGGHVGEVVRHGRRLFPGKRGLEDHGRRHTLTVELGRSRSHDCRTAPRTGPPRRSGRCSPGATRSSATCTRTPPGGRDRSGHRSCGTRARSRWAGGRAAWAECCRVIRAVDKRSPPRRDHTTSGAWHEMYVRRRGWWVVRWIARCRRGI